MKKTVTAVCLALIVLTFVFMFVYCTFFPREELSDYVNLKEKPVFSLESLFSGEYFNGMSQYFTDTVHGRDRFIDYEARIRSLYGVTENETVHRVDGSAENPSSADASSSLPDRTSTRLSTVTIIPIAAILKIKSTSIRFTYNKNIQIKIPHSIPRAL